jgi:hypothetical protein
VTDFVQPSLPGFEALQPPPNGRTPEELTSPGGFDVRPSDLTRPTADPNAPEVARPAEGLTPDQKKSLSIDVDDLIAMKLTPRPWLIESILHEGTSAMIFAKCGVGKTYAAQGIAHAVTTGGSWLDFKCSSPRGVLYIDGEMPVEKQGERFDQLAMDGSTRVKPLMLLSPDAFREELIDRPDAVLYSLAEEKGQAQVMAELDAWPEIGLVIIDSVSTLCSNGVEESDSRSWDSVQPFLQKLQWRKVAVLILHHAGKKGPQRGTSKRTDTMSQILKLEHPPDYSAEEGVRFILSFDKNRYVFGDDAAALEVTMRVDDGRAEWNWKPVKLTNRDKAFAIFSNDGTVQEVMDQISLGKSQAYELQREFRAQG